MSKNKLITVITVEYSVIMLLHIWPILGLGIHPYSMRFVMPHFTVIVFSAFAIWLSRLIKNSTDK